MTDVICKKCGTIYEGNEIPEAIQCICESTEFETREIGITDTKAEAEV
jgi:hypothetical protein|tara:strand:- start:570 stop:713 length:144 start_codon:yes stop_codon:yes gene_type:complete